MRGVLSQLAQLKAQLSYPIELVRCRSPRNLIYVA
jgi:hypothetical protein